MSKIMFFVKDLLTRLKMNLPTIVMTIFLVNIIQFIEKYLFTEIDLVPYLFFAILLDCVAGIVRAHREGTLKMGVFMKKPIYKTIEYVCFLLVVNMLAHANLFTHGTQKYLAWLPRACAVYLILVELRSTMGHLSGNRNIPVDAITTLINGFIRKNRVAKNNTNNNNSK